MAPFYGFNCLKVTETLRGDSPLFTTTSPRVLGTNLSTSEGWNAESTLDLPSDFEIGTPGLGIQRSNQKAIATYSKH